MAINYSKISKHKTIDFPFYDVVFDEGTGQEIFYLALSENVSLKITELDGSLPNTESERKLKELLDKGA